MKYFDELKRSMDWLNEQPNTLFLGQAVEYAGTGMTNTLKDVDRNKMLEMPVNEDMQMGLSLGMALNGTVPISLYPRWNFLLLAANQLINHLDKAIKKKNLYKTSPISISRSIDTMKVIQSAFLSNKLSREIKIKI